MVSGELYVRALLNMRFMSATNISRVIKYCSLSSRLDMVLKSVIFIDRNQQINRWTKTPKNLHMNHKNKHIGTRWKAEDSPIGSLIIS